MRLTRRRALALGAAMGALAPLPSRAGTGTELVHAMTGGMMPPERRLRIDAPESAGHAAAVPVTVACPDAELIRLFAPANPTPEVFTARFGPHSGNAEIITRIRMDRSQALIAVARMPDGSFVMGRTHVEVGRSGCRV